MEPLKKRCEIDLVLNLLSKGLNKAEIRQKLRIKPSTLSNHLRRLENSGYIERKGKYVINVLESSYKHLRVSKNQVHKKLNKRGHAFNFKIIFPTEKNLLEKKKVKRELQLKILEKLSFGSLKLVKDKCSIWINKGSLTIYSNNSYYVKNALHSKFRALKDVDNLVRNLKDRFGFCGIYGIEIFREHYGLIFNKFAHWIIERGNKLYVKEKGNKTILWVDNSRKDDLGLEELEGDNPLTVNSADNYFKSHEKTNWKVTPELVLKTFNKAGELIKKNAENIDMYGKNVVTHVELMKGINENLSKQTELFKKISHTLENVNKSKNL